jgi:PilZ domain
MEMPAPKFSVSESEPDSVVEVANDSDRRQHSRNVKVMRVARLKDIQLHAECLGMVRDVSSGGMMIDAHFPLEIGQSVSVALLDDQELTGEVVWKDGKTVGVKFGSEIAVDEILAKPSVQPDGTRARLPRFKAGKTVSLRVDDKSFDTELLDLSQRGAKLVSEINAKLHSNILVRLDAGRAVRATVKWRAAGMIGVEFHRLLSVDELGSWLKAD